ncbi:type II toxin-antitoxin system VapC family toxin [Tsukamurella asaccharolytica]|uniref:Ribonuclease VapC n=1 Tax=Tsukamurella asaccharolytica TaxID=2592067 RepID=A0A5C5RCN9_9ACTN|nr:PIN domain-containing protein [Tsukamurella asaccharolytica]TWS20382.1 type II toxin-antitoxin system VapC family toxin [Tsukamurella asaccharolytica]
MAGLIVVDASVLIAAFEPSDRFHDRAVASLTRALSGGDRLAASELTVAEFLVGPVQWGGLDTAEADLADLGVARVPLPPSFAPRLARIRHEARVKLPDAVVLMTALDMADGGRSVSVATYDERLRTAALDYGLSGEPR